MLLPTCPQNVDGASLYTIKPTLSNMRWTLYTMLPSTLFRSDPPLSSPSSLFNRSDPPSSDSEKIDEESVSEFLRRGVCQHMDIKDFLPKQASIC